MDIGKKNSVDHSLICKLGGFVHMRHNEVRDTEAEFISEVCKDVKTEPLLLPCNPNLLPSTTNTAPDARLDFCGRGFWQPLQQAYFDVRIFHPNSPSYLEDSTEKLYKKHENIKKTAYNKRVIEVEHGSFTPLVFSTSGGMGKEALKYHKRLAALIASKRNESYGDVMAYIRRKLRFSILRTSLIAVRGTRKPISKYRTAKFTDIDFNLVQYS